MRATVDVIAIGMPIERTDPELKQCVELAGESFEAVFFSLTKVRKILPY